MDSLSSFMLLWTSCRDPADNAPAPPDWRTPSNCANLQAPRDTWVQLRTASLVEPTHHVSVRPPAVCFFLFEMFDCLSSICFLHPHLISSFSFLFFLFCSSVVSPTWTNCAAWHFFPPSFPQRCLSLTCTSALLSPPDLESTIVCNCSKLTRAPTGNHRNSAPVCKNKTKVQQPLYYYYYATFS